MPAAEGGGCRIPRNNQGSRRVRRGASCNRDLDGGPVAHEHRAAHQVGGIAAPGGWEAGGGPASRRDSVVAGWLSAVALDLGVLEDSIHVPALQADRVVAGLGAYHKTSGLNHPNSGSSERPYWLRGLACRISPAAKGRTSASDSVSTATVSPPPATNSTS